ncbi:helix-hairpin-helix domain-containing protein [Flammeovirgaceae bacterium SG7u.111]|nr:helix-hairpin-helix domain-containing protein [Flammeovirgaceae bacterium SG7u.132]WPO35426.1 helix-hairpin-helix domain-containing protein [Flammeovirgaceae bacterium SG7u.111]
MRKLKIYLKETFGFSEAESKGFIVLMLLVFLATLAPISVQLYLPPQEIDRSQDIALLNKLVKELQAPEKTGKVLPAQKEIPKTQAARPEPFDPNVATVQKMTSVGIPKYLAERIEKYRSKGGSFRKKSDIKKIYGFSDELYEQLSPYILIEASAPKTPKKVADSKPTPKKEKEELWFDINTADTTQLKKVRGIGSVLSARIIKFRDKLGGFHATEQLSEVYGLKPEVQKELIKVSYVADEFEVAKVKINKASAQELMQHSYIGKKSAWAIFNYRKKNGGFSSIEDLKKVEVLEEGVAEKLAPYLDFEL